MCKRSVTVAVGGRAIVSPCHVADGWLSRLVGLLGTRRLDAGEGIWLEPCRSVHTWGMRQSIAVAFLDERGAVVRVVDPLPPWRVVSGGKTARVAIEGTPGAFRGVDRGAHVATR